MKDTEIEKLRQIVSRNDISGNEKVEMLIIFTENYCSKQLLQSRVSNSFYCQDEHYDKKEQCAKQCITCFSKE